MRVENKPIQFINHCFTPFIQKMSAALQETIPDIPLVISNTFYTSEKISKWPIQGLSKIIFTSQWHDPFPWQLNVYTPSFSYDLINNRPIFSAPNVTKEYRKTMQSLRTMVNSASDTAPFILGKFGIPFNLNPNADDKRTIEEMTVYALDKYYSAIENELTDSILWSYNPENKGTNGDNWNGEDTSNFSYDLQK